MVADCGLLVDSQTPRSSSVCLRFVEPWADAVFNQSQLPVLLNELRSEVDAASESGTRAQLEKVARLVEKAVGETHTYIKFIGD